jgi:hypothetical protein
VYFIFLYKVTVPTKERGGGEKEENMQITETRKEETKGEAENLPKESVLADLTFR